tara:strand:+ start:281 stop:643 length:363 start_codon:yes stop_codon:yes gene_type:complete
MIDTDKYEGHTEGKWKLHYDDSAVDGDYLDYGAQLDPVGALHPMLIADAQLIADAPLLLAEVKRLRGLLDEIDDVVYYNDEKAGQVLPVENPNLELLRDIMMSYTAEAYQIRGDEGEVIE